MTQFRDLDICHGDWRAEDAPTFQWRGKVLVKVSNHHSVETQTGANYFFTGREVVCEQKDPLTLEGFIAFLDSEYFDAYDRSDFPTMEAIFEESTGSEKFS